MMSSWKWKGGFFKMKTWETWHVTSCAFVFTKTLWDQTCPLLVLQLKPTIYCLCPGSTGGHQAGPPLNQRRLCQQSARQTSFFFFFNTTFPLFFCFWFSGCVLNLFVSFKVLYIKMSLYRCPVQPAPPPKTKPLILYQPPHFLTLPVQTKSPDQFELWAEISSFFIISAACEGSKRWFKVHSRGRKRQHVQKK